MATKSKEKNTKDLIAELIQILRKKRDGLYDKIAELEDELDDVIATLTDANSKNGF